MVLADAPFILNLTMATVPDQSRAVLNPRRVTKLRMHSRDNTPVEKREERRWRHQNSKMCAHGGKETDVRGKPSSTRRGSHSAAKRPASTQ